MSEGYHILKKSTFSVALAIAAIALSLPGSACAKQWKEIRIATEAGYAPFEYRSPSGKLEGFDIDIGNEICARLKTRCVWIDQSFDSLIPGLKARKFDLADSTMTATDARRKVIDFTVPLYVVPVKLAARKGSGLLPNAKSLKGKRVGVQQGTTMETYARKEWAPKGVIVVPYPSYTQAFADLASGRLDATFQEAQSATDGFLKKPEGANFELVGDVIKSSKILNEPIAIGLRKNNTDLKNAVDKAIESMIADGTMKKFAAKYFEPGNIVIANASK